jgi:hypothetical protein
MLNAAHPDFSLPEATAAEAFHLMSPPDRGNPHCAWRAVGVVWWLKSRFGDLRWFVVVESKIMPHHHWWEFYAHNISYLKWIINIIIFHRIW